MKEKLCFTKLDKKISANLRQLIERVEDSFANEKRTEFTETNIHETRVYIRQLKSLLYFLKPAIRRSRYQLSQHALSEGLKCFENTRETNVFIEALKTFKTLNPEYNLEIDRLIIILDQEWKLHIEEIKNHLDAQGQLPELVFWTHQASGNYLKRSKKQKMTMKKFAKNRLEDMIHLWLSNYETCDLKNQEVIHKSRVACKRIRYSFRALQAYSFCESPELLKSLESYQTISGDLHDVLSWRMRTDGMTSELKFSFTRYLEDLEAKLSEQIILEHANLNDALKKWCLLSNNVHEGDEI